MNVEVLKHCATVLFLVSPLDFTLLTTLSLFFLFVIPEAAFLPLQYFFLLHDMFGLFLLLVNYIIAPLLLKQAKNQPPS